MRVERQVYPAIAWLWALPAGAVLVAVLAAGEARSQEKKAHQFIGAKKCKTCHEKKDIGDQYGIWLESRHAKAFETLAGEKAKKWAAEQGLGDPQQDESCVKCHVTAHGAPKKLVSRKFEIAAGVQCEACHGAGRDYRKKKIMVDRDAAVARGLVLQNEKVCTTCHNDESPAWDPERYTLPDGTKAGFAYDQAVKRIAHPVPEGYDPGPLDAD